MDAFEQLFIHLDLQLNNICLVPLSFEHEQGLAAACRDGELWNLRITSTPHYTEVKDYIEKALIQKAQGSRYPFVVIEQSSGKVLGTTSYHDILLNVKRFEIGYTWYAQSAQRTHVNTSCKLLLLGFAFEQLQANTVALRTDQFNFKSQKAIERLGAKKDGIIRGDQMRKDGSIRDTVLYSIAQGEWNNVKAHLQDMLAHYKK